MMFQKLQAADTWREDVDATFTKALPQMLLMFFFKTASNKDVIHISKTKVPSPE